jgi:predicted transcriptional regulator
MKKTSTDLLERIRNWPDEDQQELADYARVIEARRTGVYRLSDDEQAAVNEGLAEADRGQFVSEADVAKQDKRHGA